MQQGAAKSHIALQVAAATPGARLPAGAAQRARRVGHMRAIHVDSVALHGAPAHVCGMPRPRAATMPLNRYLGLAVRVHRVCGQCPCTCACALPQPEPVISCAIVWTTHVVLGRAVYMEAPPAPESCKVR